MKPTPQSCVDVTVIILACNEARNIEFAVRCSAPFARAVIVVDSGSTDSTIQIARSAGARVVSHSWEGYSAQRMWAIQNLGIETTWVLFLDADETLEPGFWDELKGIIAGERGEADGADLGLAVVFGGALISHGPTGKVRLLRAFRKDKANIPLRALNEHAEVKGTVVRMKALIHHHNRNGFGRWLLKHWKYASMESAELWGNALAATPPADERAARRWRLRRTYALSPPFVRAAGWFAYRMVLEQGYRDGVRGLIFHFAQGFVYPIVIDGWFVGRAPAALLERVARVWRTESVEAGEE